MRKTIWAIVLLSMGAPAYAQTATTSGATSSVAISNPADITERLITTPTVVAPGLAAAGVETCLGSASGGVSVMGTGLTLGATTPDPGCSIRLAARQLFAFGYKTAAIALMCQDQRVFDAMAAVGQVCPSAETAPSGRPVFSTGSIGPLRSNRSAFASEPDIADQPDPSSDVKEFTAEEARLFARETQNY